MRNVDSPDWHFTKKSSGKEPFRWVETGQHLKRIFMKGTFSYEFVKNLCLSLLNHIQKYVICAVLLRGFNKDCEDGLSSDGSKVTLKYLYFIFPLIIP